MLKKPCHTIVLMAALCGLPCVGALAQSPADPRSSVPAVNETETRQEADATIERNEEVVDTTYPLVQVNLDGTALATKGLLMNGRTHLPVRELVERLGGEVRWDPHQKVAQVVVRR